VSGDEHEDRAAADADTDVDVDGGAGDRADADGGAGPDSGAEAEAVAGNERGNRTDADGGAGNETEAGAKARPDHEARAGAGNVADGEASRVLVALRVPVPAERAFAAFTEEIGVWWQPHGLFQFTDQSETGRLAFEPGPDDGRRLVETYPDGSSFGVGEVRVWEPPHRLVVSWRQSSFAADQETELHVRFDAVKDPAGVEAETRVVVEHFGWDRIPPEHAARHGFPLPVFQVRCAEWWRALLASMGSLSSPGRPGSTS
jgi:uncharacterized protein YndB with AHSA1/START domain